MKATATQTNTFLYDGWNLIREDIGAATPSSRSYVWGLDLSGTLQGAGGVGGLLMVVKGRANPPGEPLFPSCDANGNITDLVDTNGSVVAHYEYDPYANTVAQSGDQADANPFRFSSKYWDGETGFYYYGFRFYSPTLGRFINRDPLGDETFFRAFAHGKDRREKRSARQASLEPAYCFARNNAVDHYDSLGLFDPTIGARAACALGFYLANKDASGDAPECCKAKEVADKWGHCYVGCKIAFYCGIDMTMVGAVAKEIIDMFDEEDDDWSDVELDDVLASLSGIAAAESPGSCRDNCDDLICK